jgi:transcriptional regulator with XRE-family HTH domain
METTSTPIGDKVKKIFAANLTAWRGERSKADAARDLDLLPATYGRYEDGERMPDGADLLLISRRMGVSMEALLSDRMVIPPNLGRTIELTIREIVKEELAMRGALKSAKQSDSHAQRLIAAQAQEKLESGAQ